MPASSPSPSSIYLSPKRKRDDIEARHDQISATPGLGLFTDLPTRPAKEIKFTGHGSPRTVAATHLQSLQLQDHGHTTKVDFQGSSEDRGIPKAFVHQINGSGFGKSVDDNGSKMKRLNEGVEFTFGGKIHETVHSVDPNEISEIPETPTIRPTSPAIPLPSCAKLGPNSPPLRSPSPEASLTWHDSEITGHDPTDPSDDGYGINGVGFRPTPAIAQARAQKRKQQVTEWKNREARDARQRRSERRWKGGKDEATPLGGTRDGAMQHGEGTRKVRFIES